MISKKPRICVYSSSSNNLEEKFYKLAESLGEKIAKEGFDIVYGGSRLGMMYACAHAGKMNGADLYAIMPEKLAGYGLTNNDDCKEFYVTKGMRERKALMDELSDAVIALPGGFGTLEELSEIIVQKQLGYNNKAIVILNAYNFYDNLIKFIDNIMAQNFAHAAATNIYYVAQNTDDAVNYIKNYKPQEIISKFAKV